MKFTDLFTRKVLFSFDVLFIGSVSLLVLIGLMVSEVFLDNTVYSWSVVLCISLINGLYIGILKFRGDHTDHIASLRHDKTEMRARLRRLQEAISQTQKEKGAVERRINALERENRSMTLQLQLGRSNDDLHQLERSAASWHHRYQETEQRVVILEKRLSETKKKCQQLTNENTFIQQEKQQLENHDFSVCEREMERMKEVNDLRQELMRVNDLLEILEEKCQDRGNEIKDNIKKLRQAGLNDSGFGDDSFIILEENFLSDDVNRVLYILKDEKDKLDQCEREMDIRGKKIEELEQEKQSTTAQLERLISENAQYKKLVQAAQIEFKAKDTKIDEAKKQSSHLAMQVFQAKQILNDMNKQVEDAKKIQNAYMQLQTEAVTLQSKVLELAERGDELQTIVDEYEKEMTTLAETLEMLRDEKESLEDKCCALEEGKEEKNQLNNELVGKLTNVETKLVEALDEVQSNKEKLQRLDNLRNFKLIVNKQNDSE